MVESAPSDQPDPIDSDDPAVLRREILVLRDTAMGERARAELLADRIITVETELHALDAHTRALQSIVDRSPVRRVRRLLGRLLRSVTDRDG